GVTVARPTWAPALPLEARSLRGLALLRRALFSLMPPLPLTLDFDFHLDGRVLAYTALVTLATAAACGLVPALRVARSDLAAVLKGDAPGGRATFWFRSGLLVAQIAVCQFLLAGAGLLARSYLGQQSLRPGFDTDRKLVVATVLRFTPLDFPALRDKLRSLPGVRQASWAMRLPLGASGGGARRKVALPGAAGEPLPVGYTDVGPGYFGIMGTRILRGREFQDFEPGHPIVVNECMARRFWGGADAAMGRFLQVDGRNYQVTGIAEDGRYANLLEETQPWMFLPAGAGRNEGVLIAAIAGDPKAQFPAVRHALNEAAPGIAIPSLNTLRQHMRLALFAPQAGAWGTLAIALLGVFLAGVGLYGVVSHSVNRRAHEIGVRMSLGARPRNVLALVLRQAAWLVAAGSAIGLAMAFAGASVVSSLLFQVSPADPAALTGSFLAVALLALAAAHFPARRAVRLDPMTVLRRE
ncbi:MAG: FtsX-like permease family protein, partial [Acidobacteriia bacterium]|nr:FtsX-like permease family protein [Terriglobia bacterium]